MEKKLIFNVAAKELILAECVKLLPNKNYIDSIEKDFEYTGENYISVSFRNFCPTQFSVPELTLFSDISLGGNFVAKVDPFIIGTSQELNCLVRYYGIYKGSNLNPIYSINLNGIQATYKLNITLAQVNTPPVTSDILIELDNGAAYTFTIADFINHFIDIDGDDIDAIIISGDTSIYSLSGLPLVSGSLIPRSSIVDGLLKIQSQNTNNYIDNGALWQAVDSRGAISTN